MGWQGRSGRVASRIFLLGLLSASVSACGFQPLYGYGAPGQIDAQAQLKRVYVANIPDRYGQLIRLALQSQMAGAGPETPDGYTLQVNSWVTQESIDTHADNTSGRTRMTGHAHWALFTVGQSPQFLAAGDATTLDGVNSTFEQMFAENLNDETAIARVARTMADIITQQVAT